MAAPIYSQEEADALLAMPKRIEHEAWVKRKSGRPTEYETSFEVTARPEQDDEGRTEFKIEIRTQELTDSISITLKARIGKRPFEGFCRYDVSDNEHENPPWTIPPLIDAGVLHRHVYSERSMQEYDRWDKCAQLLGLSPEGSPDQLKSRLWFRFLDDLKIKFSDSETFGGLFGATQTGNE